MFKFTTSLAPRDAVKNLARLVSPSLEQSKFEKSLQQLQRLFDIFSDNCPPAAPQQGLQPTAEQHYQSELWLPLAEIRPIFARLYSSALTYPPILSSTPFADATSWAGITADLPPFLSLHSLNPALLLNRLLLDEELRTKFLFWSFMPRRFYGNGTNRYPEQAGFIRNELAQYKSSGVKLRCLDAACGDGAAAYALAGLLLEAGLSPESLAVEGWTLDPLEAWAAAHASFPHNPSHQAAFRDSIQPVASHLTANPILFRQADLLAPPNSAERFDIILCNGLLGGPLINAPDVLARIVANLSSLLSAGGILLAADNFHGGWKQKYPQKNLRALFENCGLNVFTAGEGIGAGKR